jgi:hypothetical protein
VPRKAPRLLRPVAVFLLLGMVLDCAGAPERVVMPPAPASFKPRQELEVWQGREAITLHGVRITGDSLTGVPAWKPPACDSCRVAVPVSAIDSIRTVDNERAWMLAASLPFVALGAVAVIFALSAGSD